ncbi:MAG: hypothetical protein QOD85_273, partial [Gaiellaceae bacterium]|nr:hypothetical protein [Gaiellaceae bacterium]
MDSTQSGFGVSSAPQVDRERLVATASSLIDVHSFTGNEQAMAERMV